MYIPKSAREFLGNMFRRSRRTNIEKEGKFMNTCQPVSLDDTKLIKVNINICKIIYIVHVYKVNQFIYLRFKKA